MHPKGEGDSICHEIAHTFFPDCYTQVQHRRKGQHFDSVHAELEMLCHVGAGELLMPLEEFTANAGERHPCFSTATELGDVFNASQEAALRRMVDLSRKACCLIWLTQRLKPAEEKSENPDLNWDVALPNPKPKLRVDYTFASAPWKTFIPRHKSIPDSSVLYEVLRGTKCEPRSEDWSELRVGRTSVEAVSSIHAHPASAGLMALLTLS